MYSVISPSSFNDVFAPPPPRPAHLTVAATTAMPPPVSYAPGPNGVAIQLGVVVPPPVVPPPIVPPPIVPPPVVPAVVPAVVPPPVVPAVVPAVVPPAVVPPAVVPPAVVPPPVVPPGPPPVVPPGPPPVVPPPVVPPPVVPPPAPPAVLPFPPATVTLIHNALLRYLHPASVWVYYPYRIIVVEIDPRRIAGRVLGAGGVQQYPWRTLPAVPLGGAYPAGYNEVETVLTGGTTAALLTSIVGNFPRNRNRVIREIYGQTSDFRDGIALDCPNIQITNHLTFMDWLSRLSGLIDVPRVQVIRARGDGGIDSPPPGAGAHIYINPTVLNDPPAL